MSELSEEVPSSPPSSPEVKNKVLFLIASTADSNADIGYDIIELTRSIRIFLAYQFIVDIASIHGGKTSPDPDDLCSGDPDVDWFLENSNLFQKTQATKSIYELHAEDWDAIYFVGGYPAMWEFRDNPDLDEFARKVYDRGGVLGFVGHGAIALASIHTSTGELLVEGKTVTGFSNEEELYGKMDQDLLPKSEDGLRTVEDVLKHCGANYTKVHPFANHICRDRRIVTGQNRDSAESVANAMISDLMADR